MNARRRSSLFTVRVFGVGLIVFGVLAAVAFVVAILALINFKVPFGIAPEGWRESVRGPGMFYLLAPALSYFALRLGVSVLRAANDRSRQNARSVG